MQRILVPFLLLFFLPFFSFSQAPPPPQDATSWPAFGDSAPYQVPPPRPPRWVKTPAWGRAQYVLMISIDGLGWEIYKRYKTQSPLLMEIEKRGVACPMETVFPSMTWASHVSLVTGQYPRWHGVLGNRWLERYDHLIYPFQTDAVEPQRYDRTPSLYDLAHKQGWKTAAINWPATQKSKTLTYNWPEVMYRGDIAFRLLSPPLKDLMQMMYRRENRPLPQAVSSTRHLELLFGTLSVSEVNDTDMLVADLTSEIVAPSLSARFPRPKDEIPRVMMTHFLTLDSWFHKYGPTPWIARWGLRQIDLYLQTVVQAYKKAGIWDKTAIFVTSDHGFSSIKYAMDLRLLLVQHGLARSVKMDAGRRQREDVMAFYNGHTAFVYIRPKARPKRLPQLVKILRSSAYSRCIDSLYTPFEYSKLGLPWPSELSPKAEPWKHDGAPTLIVLSKPDCLFRLGHRRREIIQTAARHSPEWFFGGHGYLPNSPEMMATLLAAGPGIRQKGRCPRQARIVDVAPTAAHTLGLEWPRVWGPSSDRRKLLMDGVLLRSLLAGKRKPAADGEGPPQDND